TESEARTIGIGDADVGSSQQNRAALSDRQRGRRDDWRVIDICKGDGARKDVTEVVDGRAIVRLDRESRCDLAAVVNETDMIGRGIGCWEAGCVAPVYAVRSGLKRAMGDVGNTEGEAGTVGIGYPDARRCQDDRARF